MIGKPWEHCCSTMWVFGSGTSLRAKALVAMEVEQRRMAKPRANRAQGPDGAEERADDRPLEEEGGERAD